jgi:hypothetical protein
MNESTIPISAVTLARLQELARWAGISLDEALDRAIKDQYDAKFWAAVNDGYAALRADPAVWAEIETERKLWDNTLTDGLDPSERWTDQGEAPPPAARDKAS